MGQPQHTAPATDIMANTSEKRDSIAELKKPRCRSKFRRFLNALKRAAPSKVQRKTPDTPEEKPQPVFPVAMLRESQETPMPVRVRNFSKPSISEADLRTAYPNEQDFTRYFAQERPVTAHDHRLPPKLPTVSEGVEPEESTEPRRATSEYQNSVRRYAASRRSVQSSRSATMITPELMQQIQRSNRRRSGASLRDAAMRPGSSGTVDGVPMAKLVVANPLRWSEE